jgi:hypothetical protein
MPLAILPAALIRALGRFDLLFIGFARITEGVKKYMGPLFLIVLFFLAIFARAVYVDLKVAKARKDGTVCPTCGGVGYLTHRVDYSALPAKFFETTCPTCSGNRIIFRPSETLPQEGRKNKRRKRSPKQPLSEEQRNRSGARSVTVIVIGVLIYFCATRLHGDAQTWSIVGALASAPILYFLLKGPLLIVGKIIAVFICLAMVALLIFAVYIALTSNG